MYTMDKDAMNSGYKSAITAVGVAVLCFATRKALGKKWELVPINTPMEVVKLTLALILVGAAVEAVQDRKWVPTKPFKGV